MLFCDKLSGCSDNICENQDNMFNGFQSRVGLLPSTTVFLYKEIKSVISILQAKLKKKHKKIAD